MTEGYKTYRITWEGIALSIRWCPDWLGRNAHYSVAHLELVTETGEALPVTNTGYRSHFVQREAVEAYESPIAYVKAWLDHEAQSREWQQYCAERVQLALF